MAPINALADEIADRYDLPRGAVPYLDPDQGGIHARALILLDTPGPKAKMDSGSGLLSLDNDDPTAACLRKEYALRGVDWKDVVHWNVCPFPTSDPDGQSTTEERQIGAQWTRRLVALLPYVRTVLPLGGNARDGWKRAGITGLYDFADRRVPHPSRRGLGGGRQPIFEDAILDLAGRLG
ncbi:uracil-DNA glycosylase [Nocardia sp. NPDC004340]|uniref:uracil-DNA glycosylase n=1 Tax=Nocardia sp. CA-136227 TaxID=3239979 RepID=UPI003D9694A4